MMKQINTGDAIGQPEAGNTEADTEGTTLNPDEQLVAQSGSDQSPGEPAGICLEGDGPASEPDNPAMPFEPHSSMWLVAPSALKTWSLPSMNTPRGIF